MIAPSLTILFDNYPHKPGLTSLWGFSALVVLPHATVLFDTGSNGRVLLKNMAALGLNPKNFDLLFLSHPHWDHMGGLDSVLELNPDLRLVVHEGFSKHLIRDLETQCAELTVCANNPIELLPDVYSTGMLAAEPPEQALVFKVGRATVAVSGCAHPGMERIVEVANRFLPQPVNWAVGGFHLLYADRPTVDRSIHALRNLGVTHVVPTHCSGDAARTAFAGAYGNDFIDGGVGRVIRFDA